MFTFDQLVSSRKEWIESVLRPWSIQAPRKELIKAAMEWTDIAGKVSPESTLWTWAWSRFPELIYDGLEGVNETLEVEVQMKDGSIHVGFPNNNSTEYGNLVLLLTERQPHSDSSPLSIDEIVSVKRKL